MNILKRYFKIGLFGASILSLIAPALPVYAGVGTHSEGTNIKTSNGTVWMITSDHCRKAYTSSGAFLSYGFNSFDQLVDATAEDLALPECTEKFIPPQDGQVIVSDRGADINTAYFVSGGQKRGFVSRAVYDGLGFPTSRLAGSATIRADISWLPKGPNIETSDTQHLSGTLVNQDGTIYLIVDGGKLGIPDSSIFNSWKYDYKNSVLANRADRALTVIGTITPRQPGIITPSSGPTLIVSDSFASFNYTRGGSVPPNYLAHISNNSSTQGISYTISVPNKPAWLNTNYTTTPLTLGPLETAGIGIAVDPANLAAGSYTTVIKFTGNFANSPASITVTLIVSNPNTPTLQITSDSNLPPATIGQAYSTQLQVSGGVAPYTWSPVSTTYPSGCCVLGINTATGIFNTQSSATVINTHPAGTYSWVLKVTDSAGNTATKTFYLVINPAPTQSASITITTDSLPAGKVGMGYSAEIHFTKTTNYALNATISGQPSGTGFGGVSGPNANMGILYDSTTISGTPTQAGTFSMILTLTDQYNPPVSKTFTIVVNP